MVSSGGKKRISQERQKQIDELFLLYDTDKSGSIDLQELGKLLRALNFCPSNKEVERMMKKYTIFGTTLRGDAMNRSILAGDVNEMKNHYVQSATYGSSKDVTSTVRRMVKGGFLTLQASKLSTYFGEEDGGDSSKTLTLTLGQQKEKFEVKGAEFDTSSVKILIPTHLVAAKFQRADVTKAARRFIQGGGDDDVNTFGSLIIPPGRLKHFFGDTGDDCGVFAVLLGDGRQVAFTEDEEVRVPNLFFSAPPSSSSSSSGNSKEEESAPKVLGLTKEEFVTLILEEDIPEQPSEKALKDAFDALDTDGSGFLSQEELKVALTASGGEPLSSKEADRLFTTYDANNDGKLSFDEFVALLQGMNPSGGGGTQQQSEGAKKGGTRRRKTAALV